MKDLEYDQYVFEKSLGRQLLNTTAKERKEAYKRLYSEFFRKFPKVSFDPYKKIEHKLQWQSRLLRPYLRESAVFMEIGAGNCLLSLKISENVQKVIAYEVADTVPYVERKPKNFNLKVFDGLDFVEEEDSVDIIYSNDVFEHLHCEDISHHLCQYHNILKIRGKLVIVTPHALTGPHDISRNFSKKPEGFHMKEYTYKEMKKILSTHRFAKIRALLGNKKFGYFEININFLITFEILYSIIPLGIRYSLRNNPILAKIFTIKVIGTKLLN
jgi:hypothetical protein